MIAHNLETTPFQIKTDSAAESGHSVYVHLYTAGGDNAGSIYFHLTITPKYWIDGCLPSYNDFHSALTSEVNRVWQISKLPGPRLTLQCNGVTVVDLLMSDTTCSVSNWSKFWRRQVEQIKFSKSYNTASDEFWGPLPGEPLAIHKITCLFADAKI